MRRLAMLLGVGAALALGAAPAQAFVGTNSNAITGPANGARGKANLYPSTIGVSGEFGNYGTASVTLHGVTTTAESDLDVMLVAPSGERILLASDAGGSGDLSNGDLTFHDDADPLPGGTPFSAGTYRPTDVSTACAGRSTSIDDDFDAPAPTPLAPDPGFHPFRTAFFRSQVNGTWQLYVMDDCAADTVTVSGGWTLDVRAIPGPGNVGIPLSGTSGPASTYPVAIPVAGLPNKVTKVTAEIVGLTHTHPDDLDMLLVGPTGASTLLMSDAGGDGNVEMDDGSLFFDDSAGPLPDSSQIATDGRYRPTDYDPGDTFPAPAPAGPYGSALAAFNGTDPNGTWRLFVNDDAGADVGGFQIARLAITATSAGGGSTTTTVVGAKDTDTTKPRGKLTALRGQTLASVLQKGVLGLKLTVNEASRFSGQAILPADEAKRLKLPPNGKALTSRAAKRRAKPAIVGTGKGRAPKAGSYTLKLKLTRKARRALKKRGRKVTLGVRTRITDRAGNRRLVKRSLTLKP